MALSIVALPLTHTAGLTTGGGRTGGSLSSLGLDTNLRRVPYLRNLRHLRLLFV